MDNQIIVKKQTSMRKTNRLKQVFNRQKPDRVPVLGFVGVYAAKLAGVPIYEYYRNPGLAIDLQLKAKSLHGYDDNPHFGWADWGGWEFGGQVAFPTDYRESAPKTAVSAIDKPSQVDDLEIPDPATAGMMPLIHEYNRHITAMGLPAKIQAGSVTLLVSGIIGRDRLLRWYLREPNAVKVVYDKAADFILQAARLTVEQYGTNCSAGYSAALDTNDLISPDLFARFCLPVQAKVNQGLLDMGVSGFSMHLCGNHKQNLKLWATLPWPERMTFSVGPETDLEIAAAAFDHRHIIAGHVSTTLLAHGNYEDVYNDARRCLDIGKTLPGGFILMSGCEMPVLAPPLNVHAMVQAARDHGGYP